MTYITKRLDNAAGVFGTFPRFTDNGDGTFDATGCVVLLYEYANHMGELKAYNITGVTNQSTTLNGTDYLVVNYNSGSPEYQVLSVGQLGIIDESLVIPIVTIYNTDDTKLHIIEWENLGRGLGNKLHARFVKTARFGRESGIALSGSTDGYKTVAYTSGVIWFGAVRKPVNGHIGSSWDSGETWSFFYHVGGEWIRSEQNSTNSTTVQTDISFTATDTISNAGSVDFTTILSSGDTFSVESTSTTNDGTYLVDTVSATTITTIETTITTETAGAAGTVELNRHAVFNNTQWDDGTDLQSLAANRYTINWVARDVDTESHLGYMLDGQYTSLAEAIAAPMPEMPPVFASHGVLLGRIIARQGDNTFAQTDSAFELDVTGTPVSLHNDLGTLQGGTTDEYYHLTSAEHTDLQTGYPVAYDTYIEKPQNNSEQNIHGGMIELTTGTTPLDSGNDIVVQQGIGKLYLVAQTGGDAVGTVTVSGTVVDRDTGATGADTDTLTLDTLSTDNSTTDANGNPVNDIVDGYMTSKWFTGEVTFSTSDVTLTDADVYHVSFDQGNDSDSVAIETFDINVEALTTSSTTLSAHVYSVEITTGDKADIQTFADMEITSVTTANRYYRLRRGNLAKTINGVTDGLFIDVFFAGTNGWGSFSMKLWGRINPA